MKTISRTAVCRIEPLESRIAPAGVVLATLAGGVLTLTGDDAANDLDVKIGAAAVTLTPDASTSINGGALGAVAVLPGVATSLRAAFKNGDDNIAIDPAADFVLPKGAVFAMGDSDNTLTLTTTGKFDLGSLTVTGGDGFDTFTMAPSGSVRQVSGATVLRFGDGGSDTDIRA